MLQFTEVSSVSYAETDVAVLYGGCHSSDIFIRDCLEQSQVTARLYVTNETHTYTLWPGTSRLVTMG